MIIPTLAYLPTFINRILKLFDKGDFHVIHTVFLTLLSEALSLLLKNPEITVIARFSILHTVFGGILRMAVEIVFFALLLLWGPLFPAFPSHSIAQKLFANHLIFLYSAPRGEDCENKTAALASLCSPSAHLIRKGETSNWKLNMRN